jgi:hypothetical protein
MERLCFSRNPEDWKNDCLSCDLPDAMPFSIFHFRGLDIAAVLVWAGSLNQKGYVA